MSFWQELKRRNVFRVGAVYLAIAWLIAQIISVVNEPLTLPGWFDTIVILLLAAGFPVALILAWALELTPDGIRVDEGTAETRRSSSVTGRTIDFAIIAVLVVALGVTLWNRDEQAPQNSVAVLRFVNLSGESAQDYFSDGMAAEIQGRLARIEDLVVAGQNSSFQFDAGAGDYGTIGTTLNVAYVLEGSVLRSGNQVRVSPQLVRAADGVTVWADAYNREGDDSLSVFDDISLAVADALSLTLGIGEPQLRYVGTDSFEAFDWFLKGRELWIADPARAIPAFTRATEIDPAYALPWAWLSSSYGILAQRSTTPEEIERNYENMLRSAQRAVQLGPELWDTHRALAWARMGENDWIGADEAFRQAINMARRSGARTSFQYATYVEALGHLDETIESLEALRETDPLNQENAVFLANALAVLGRFEEALAEMERFGQSYETLGCGPSFPWYIERGDVNLVKACLARSPADIDRGLSEVVDSRDAALAFVSEALETPDDIGRWNLAFLALYAGYYGDTGLANRALREAFLRDGWGAYFLIWHEVLSETRQTEEFEDFLTEFGLVELFRSTGEWNDYCRPVGTDDFECV